MNKMLVTAVCSAAMSVCFAQGTAAPTRANAAGGVDLAALAERLSQLESAMKNPSPDVAALAERISQLEGTVRTQAERIAELEGRNKVLAQSLAEVENAAKSGVADADGVAAAAEVKTDDSTTRSESGRIFTTDLGKKYYLADATAGIFEPLTKGGMQITPYGYLTFEAVHNTHKTATDIYTDWVLPRGARRKNGDHQTVFSMNDSILGFNFEAPEAQNGWRFNGKFEFDLVGDDANHPDFHFRHLYFAMDNADEGWNILFGQTWHLWKMVTPNEIDGAWLEQTGHPYRRSPQIRVTKTFSFEDESALELRAGVVKNGNGMGGDRDKDDNQDNTASAWPLLEGAAVYTRKAGWEDKSRKWLVGLAGMYGRDKSHRFGRDDDGNFSRLSQSDEYDTKMVMAAAQLPFFDKFTLTGQLFAGENLSGVQAGIGQGVAIKDPERRGSEVKAVGGFIDRRYDLNDRWGFAVGYGFDDPNDSRARYAAGRTFNERAYADAFFRFNANLHFAVEYAHLRTKYYSDDDANDDRFQFSAYYDF